MIADGARMTTRGNSRNSRVEYSELEVMVQRRFECKLHQLEVGLSLAYFYSISRSFFGYYCVHEGSYRTSVLHYLTVVSPSSPQDPHAYRLVR